jgi:hypothetical protein
MSDPHWGTSTANTPGALPREPAALADGNQPRPTRAELRRAAESSVGLPETHQANAPVLSRSEQRRIAELQAKASSRRRALWKAWWIYPLLVGIAACAWFAVQSARVPGPPPAPVVTTISAQP